MSIDFVINHCAQMHPLRWENSTDISESTYHLVVRERDYLYQC